MENNSSNGTEESKAEHEGRRFEEGRERFMNAAKRRHQHLVIIASCILVVSCVCFGLEVLGAATVFGIVGTLMLAIADL